MVPPVRALISRALAATSVRVEPVGEELAVLGRARLGARELPPALMLVLREPALLAAGHQDKQRVDEVSLVLRGNPESRSRGQAGTRRRLPRSSSEDGNCAGVTISDLSLERQLDPAGGNQIAEYPTRPGRRTGSASWCPAGGGRSPGKKRKPCSAGRSRRPRLPRARNRKAPRLATWNRAGLVDDHLDVALGQLVGSAHAGDSSTQDDDLHRRLLSPQSRPTATPLF